MNAKKIMGAVLVALLAAALFVGAGAAASSVSSGDTVFLYQAITNGDVSGTWTSEDGKYTISVLPTTAGGDVYFAPGSAFVEGVYEQGDKNLTIKYPTATITGVAGSSPNQYMFIGATLYANAATVTATSPATDASLAPVKILLISKEYPTGEVISSTTQSFSLSNLKKGEYKVQAVFDSKYFVDGTPADLLLGKDVFTFTVADAGDATISADVAEINSGKNAVLTITGTPGETYKIAYPGFNLISYGTLSFSDADKTTFVMPNTGKVTLGLEALTSSGDYDITVSHKNTAGEYDEKDDVTIEILKGVITAKTDKDSYFIGDDVKLTGTSTAGDVYFYWAGTNVPFQALNLTKKTTFTFEAAVEADDTWEYKITGDKFQFYDAGTYTIYVSNTNNPLADEVKDLDIYTTVSLVLKQPFISITNAPAVAVSGTDYTVTGTAEAATDLYVYIFGTNFFEAGNKDTQIVAFNNAQIVSFDKDNKNEFTIEFEVQNMSAGQYFMVIQHPMYDEVFNIQPVGEKITLMPSEVLFTVDKRQTANAAQALCDALDTQNIDDMYVKLSFVVAAPESVINPIPSEVTKGSKLTVSGSTNMGAGELVTVEMVSTAFAAQPKETVGSASYIVLTTKTDENGNWEITFDTTGLNVDEYTVTAAVAGLNSATAKVNVIEGAPTEQPTTTPTTTPTQEQPTETTTPETPGFGALAALAGLGAVAVLLLRRE